MPEYHSNSDESSQEEYATQPAWRELASRWREQQDVTAKSAANREPPRYVELPNGNIEPYDQWKKRTDRDRERNRINAQNKRSRDKASMAAMLAECPIGGPPALPRDLLIREARAFREWLAIGGPRQRQFKPRQRLYMAARVVLLTMRAEDAYNTGDEHGADPRNCAFAARLTQKLRESRDETLHEAIDDDKARNLLKQIVTKLEAVDGPWPAQR